MIYLAPFILVAPIFLLFLYEVIAHCTDEHRASKEEQ